MGRRYSRAVRDVWLLEQQKNGRGNETWKGDLDGYLGVEWMFIDGRNMVSGEIARLARRKNKGALVLTRCSDCPSYDSSPVFSFHPHAPPKTLSNHSSYPAQPFQAYTTDPTSKAPDHLSDSLRKDRKRDGFFDIFIDFASFRLECSLMQNMESLGEDSVSHNQK